MSGYTANCMCGTVAVEGLEFKPGLHVNYESTIMPMKDSLPKFKDFPEDFGGSGETLPE